MMASESDGSFSVTYLQTRPLPQQRSSRPWRLSASKHDGVARQTARRLHQLGFEQREIGDFYDVALGDAGLFWRLSGSPISFLNPAWDEQGVVIERPEVSILLAETGHYVLGIGLCGRFQAGWLEDGQADRRLAEMALMAQEQSTEEPQEGRWTLDRPLWAEQWSGTPPSCSASLRRAFDLLGFALHEVLLDRRPAPFNLEGWSKTWQDANSRCHAIHDLGEVDTPYVATWGYHAEWEFYEERLEERDTPAPATEALIQGMLNTRGIGNRDVATLSIQQEYSKTRWVIGDFESIRTTVRSSQSAGTQAADDANRARGLIEYFAYRRGAVTLIQRDILRCSIHEAAVRREQVVNWVWTFATVTDDYVLAGWSIGLLRSVRAAIETDLHTWDLEHREEQVRGRLDSFQSQFEAEQGRLSTALGLVFGVFAYASVLPLLSFAFAWILDNPSVTDAPLERPWIFLTVNAILLGVLLPASLWLVRRAGSLRFPGQAQRS